MKLNYGVKDRPSFGKIILFALQQLLAIMAATIAVPSIIGNGMSQSAALFGAGAGTIIYLLFTKFKSPVFLGSSFAFLGSMSAAFAGAGAVGTIGYIGLIIGAIFAGLVYVVIALICKKVGYNWINKIMPAVIIGPTVAIIGLSLAGNAVGDFLHGSLKDANGNYIMSTGTLVNMIVGLVTLLAIIIVSVFSKKFFKTIPFLVGMGCGYIVATIFTLIGKGTDNVSLQLVNFELFKNIEWIPDFSFIKAIKGFSDINDGAEFAKYVGTIAVAYVPVAFVVFAEHLADHKNLSSIIEQDLLADPGVDKTLLGDGVGSMVGAIFGGCPNTTYGESIGCVAISGNASVITILFTGIMAIIISFIGPFATLLKTIPSAVMGGACVALYGFIAVSGLKMLQNVDLGDNRNLFVASTILIAGVGGFALNIEGIILTKVACALILGLIVYAITLIGKSKDQPAEEKKAEEQE